MLDLGDRISGRRDPMTPPRRAIEEIGGFDFRQIGNQLASMAIDFGKLEPDGHLVDAGCGYGRLAVPLTGYLTAGAYTGFDISRPAIRWCERHITARFANFRFAHLDVRNGHYNRRGTIAAEQAVWPVPDASATVLFAGSLFTHLTFSAVRRYFEEAARVLRPGGRCVASFFLINDESRARIEARRGEPKLRFISNDVAVQDVDDPEAAIAYSETVIRSVFAAAGFRIIDILYGSWCERPSAVAYQDFVIARRA